MHPDFWSSVHHLLLCSCHANHSTAYLENTLEAIHQTLPQATVQWLLLDSNNHYHLISDWNTPLFAEGTVTTSDPVTIVAAVQACHFDAAIILTLPGQSPYQLAYLCYLAGIPIRLGQSHEFGGGVLSHCIQPPLDPVPPTQYILHLFNSTFLPPCPPTPGNTALQTSTGLQMAIKGIHPQTTIA